MSYSAYKTELVEYIYVQKEIPLTLKAWMFCYTEIFLNRYRRDRWVRDLLEFEIGSPASVTCNSMREKMVVTVDVGNWLKYGPLIAEFWGYVRYFADYCLKSDEFDIADYHDGRGNYFIGVKTLVNISFSALQEQLIGYYYVLDDSQYKKMVSLKHPSLIQLDVFYHNPYSEAYHEPLPHYWLDKDSTESMDVPRQGCHNDLQCN